jgi:hypothetical protein
LRAAGLRAPARLRAAFRALARFADTARDWLVRRVFFVVVLTFVVAFARRAGRRFDAARLRRVPPAVDRLTARRAAGSAGAGSYGASGC